MDYSSCYEERHKRGMNKKRRDEQSDSTESQVSIWWGRRKVTELKMNGRAQPRGRQSVASVHHHRRSPRLALCCFLPTAIAGGGAGGGEDRSDAVAIHGVRESQEPATVVAKDGSGNYTPMSTAVAALLEK